VPASIVWLLRPLEPATLPASLGRAAQAVFLRHVATVDESLAEALHVPDKPRPFTCSSLIGATRASHESVTVTPENEYRLRFTVLHEPLEGIAMEPPPSVALDGCQFAVEGVLEGSKALGWVARATWEELSAPWLLSHRRATSRVELEFVSPTTFRSAGMLVPLPLPGLVFGSLLDRWNCFAPVALHEDLRRYAEECVAVERYRLHTRALRMKSGVVQRGFVGECAYRMLRKDQFWMSQLQLLADAALYLGVGYQTVVGMGQSRRRPARR